MSVAVNVMAGQGTVHYGCRLVVYSLASRAKL